MWIFLLETLFFSNKEGLLSLSVSLRNVNANHWYFKLNLWIMQWSKEPKRDAGGKSFSYLLFTLLRKVKNNMWSLFWPLAMDRSYGLQKDWNRMTISLHKCPYETMYLKKWQECFHWGRVPWMYPVLWSASTGRYKEWSPQRTHWQQSLCSGERWRETVVEEERMREKEAWWKELEICSRAKERKPRREIVGERGWIVENMYDNGYLGKLPL